MTQLDTVTFSEKEKGRILSAMVAYEKKEICLMGCQSNAVPIWQLTTQI